MNEAAVDAREKGAQQEGKNGIPPADIFEQAEPQRQRQNPARYVGCAQGILDDQHFETEDGNHQDGQEEIETLARQQARQQGGDDQPGDGVVKDPDGIDLRIEQ